MIIKKKFNSRERALSVLITNTLFVIMWLVDAFYVQMSDSYHSDYMEYYNVYNGIKENYFEIGYYYIGLVAKHIGFNFFSFRLIIVTVTILLMRNSILKYSKDPVTITLIYMIHPFLLQCIQLRNALSIAIVIFALRYLDINNYKPWKFVLFIIVGTLFHTSALLYAIIILCICIKPKRTIAISALMLIFMETILLFFKKNIVMFAADILNVSKIAYYLNMGETRVFTLSMAIYFLIYIVCVCVFIRFNNMKTTDSMDKVLLMSSILVLTYIPLMLVHYDYFRIYEYYFPVITIALFNYLHGRSVEMKLYKIVIKAGFTFIVVYRYVMWWIIDNNDGVLGNILLFK